MSLELCIARYLLMSKREGKKVKTVDLIAHIVRESYNPDDLLKIVDDLEKRKFIKSDKSFWIITQVGINHYFRVSERD